MMEYPIKIITPPFEFVEELVVTGSTIIETKIMTKKEFEDKYEQIVTIKANGQINLVNKGQLEK